jgi:hypothetical protein
LKGYSKYVSSGMAVEIKWTPEKDDFSQDLWTLLLVENALLRVWQLRALSTKVRAVGRTRRQEFHLQQQALFGLREIRESVVNYGSARDQSDALVAELGGDSFETSVLQLLAQHGQVAEVRKAARQARTQSIAGVLALVAATVFGLPPIEQTLDAAKRLPTEGLVGTLAAPMKSLAQRPDGAFIAYLGLLTLLVLALLVAAWRPRRPKIPRAVRVGRPWRFGTIRIVQGDEEPLPEVSTDAENRLVAAPFGPPPQADARPRPARGRAKSSEQLDADNR